jgi:hypothetical protein
LNWLNWYLLLSLSAFSFLPHSLCSCPLLSALSFLPPTFILSPLPSFFFYLSSFQISDLCLPY